MNRVSWSPLWRPCTVVECVQACRCACVSTCVSTHARVIKCVAVLVHRSVCLCVCLCVHPLGLIFGAFVITPSVPPFTTMTAVPSTPGRELPWQRDAQALRRLHLLPLESGRPGPGCSLAVALQLRTSAGWVLP